MVTAVTLSLALALEPAEANVMQRPPRNSSEPLLSGFMRWRIAFVSVLLVIAPLSLFHYEMAQEELTLDAARTLAVNALVMGEIFYLFNSRYLYDSVLSRQGCSAVVMSSPPSVFCWCCNWLYLLSADAALNGRFTDERRQLDQHVAGWRGGTCWWN
ncbi:MAG: cation transporting ATPase C-terminal domain-containing protein [Candidatus Competibacteraceae bacterium]|nr:cation transporting ATPase C-terminal domain-containing protein [Candidatus Competibacteraceae bacterium]